jgi:SAM-dependent methyltransferase
MNESSTYFPNNLQILSELPEHDEGFSVRERRALLALAQAEDQHFWHRTRNLWISDRLRAWGTVPPATILELGCGGGCVSAHLNQHGYTVTGVEGHAVLAQQAALRAPEAHFFVCDLEKDAKTLPQQHYDAVAMFDVLEHLDDPRSALELAAHYTRPGGLIVGTVPALQWLWSQVDVQAGHRLRYEREDLKELLSSLPGLQVLEVMPFNRWLVPVMWMQRKFVVRNSVAETSEQNFKVPQKPINLTLYALTRLEHHLAQAGHWQRGWGSSLWFAIRKGL